MTPHHCAVTANGILAKDIAGLIKQLRPPIRAMT